VTRRPDPRQRPHAAALAPLFPGGGQEPWAEAAQHVPDRRLILSGNKTLKRKISTLTVAVAGSAIAVGAIASSMTASVTSAADATGQATVATEPKVISAPSIPRRAALDAFATPARADTNAASQRAETPRQVAWYMLSSFGWSYSQFQWLNDLWVRESGWNPRAENPYSGAYGIPQAVPGSKMASAGPNWRTSARTQILWGLRYIKGQYGSPSQAWQHELAYGWY